MCGRTTHLYTWREVAEHFGMDWARPMHGLQPDRDLAPRYNVAPGQFAPVVPYQAGGDGGDGGDRRLDLLRWGLIPPWAKDEKFGWRTINARGETVAAKPAFRSAFKRRRCIVPVSGFYEWRAPPSDAPKQTPKQPFYITPRAGPILALAGLWERWSGGADGASLETFTIVTTEANAGMAPLHDRMPVILSPETYDLWLDPTVDDARVLQPLLRPAPEDVLVYDPVSRLVNRPGHDSPDCIEPIALDGEAPP